MKFYPYISGSPNAIERDNNDSDSPSRIPLCVNGLIPVPSNLSDPQVLQALAGQWILSRTINIHLFFFN